MSTPPLPAGYALDQPSGPPPLPAGYQLDSAATPSVPTYNSLKDQYGTNGAGLVFLPKGVSRPPATADNQAQFQQEQTSQLSKAAQMGMGGGGIKTVGAGAVGLVKALPSVERAGEAFKEVSAAAGSHTVPVTNALSDALMQYHQLVETGGSRSLAVSKLLNRLTIPEKGPLTYDEARLFASNISRLSADEAQRLTPVMKRAVGQIAGSLGDAISATAESAGKLEQYQAAMKEYAQAKNLADKLAILKKYAIRGGLAAAGGGLTALAGRAIYEASE